VRDYETGRNAVFVLLLLLLIFSNSKIEKFDERRAGPVTSALAAGRVRRRTESDPRSRETRFFFSARSLACLPPPQPPPPRRASKV